MIDLLLETEFDILYTLTKALAAQAQSLDEGPVALLIFTAEVSQKPSATTDQLQQTTARVMVVNVQLKVLNQLIDAFS